MENLLRYHISLENYLLFDRLNSLTKTLKISHKTVETNSVANLSIEATKHWTFSSSVLFSFTILTTIGID